MVLYTCNEARILLAIESKSASTEDKVVEQGKKNIKFTQAEAERQGVDKVFFVLISTVADAAAVNVKKFAEKWTEGIWESVSCLEFKKSLTVKAFAISLMEDGKVDYNNFFKRAKLNPVCLVTKQGRD